MIEELLQDAVARTEWLLLMLAIIIIVGPLIAARFRLPGLIGLILSGLVLGPFVFGLLPEGFLDAVGGIGLLLLMFMAGAELDLNLFQRYRSAAIVFGLLTFIMPFLFGWLSALWLDMTALAAILMGSVWASHTLVAYPAVRQAGLSGNKAVATSVSATVITDTLAMIVLAIVAAVAPASGEEAADPVLVTIKLVVGLGVLVLWTMVILPRMARRFYMGIGQDRMLRFVFVIGALATSGLLATIVGIEGIVGAFFCGLGLNRLIPNGGQLMERVEFFGSSLFIPAFLVSVGMLLDPGVLLNVSTLAMAAVFFVALAAGKYAAAWIAGRRYKFSQAEIGMMFALTIAQAAATLASTLVGVEIGLFSDQVMNAVLIVVLVSLILTSVTELRYAGRIAPESLVMKPLGQSVIVPVTSSVMLEQTMRLACDIAYSDAGIVVPVAIAPERDSIEGEEAARQRLERAEEYATAFGADAEGVLRIDDAMHIGTVRELVARRGSLIILEWSHAPTASDFLFGSMIDKIGARSPAPAIAVRWGKQTPTRVVLAPGKPLSTTGYRVDLQVAQQLAKHLAGARNLPLRLLASDGRLPDELALPEAAETISVEPGLNGIRKNLLPEDLLIVPGATMRQAIGSLALNIAKESDQFTIIVAAGPYRLNLSKAETAQETETIISFGTSGSMRTT